MKNYLIFSLILVICFPSLFSYFVPLFVFALIYQAVVRPKCLEHAITPKIAIGFCVMMIASVFLVLFNVIKFGDISPWTYWIAGFLIWPVIVVLIRGVDSPAEVIHKSLLYSSLIVGGSCLIYIALFFLRILPEPISVPGYQAYFGLDERGFFAYSTTHVPHIPYLLAYLVTYGALKKGAIKRLELIAIILMVISGVLSLRSFVAISIFGVLIYYVSARRRLGLLLVGVLIVLIVGVSLYQNSDAARGVLGGIYDLKWSGKFSGEDVRYKQLAYWFESFSSSPFWGHGLSSVRIEMYDIATGELQFVIPGPIDAPYGYEIYYGKLLSDIGLVFLVYVVVFCMLSFSGGAKKVGDDLQLKALRLSAIVMMLQSATNSYLGTSGWMFILMLPMALARLGGFAEIRSKFQNLSSPGVVCVPSCDEALPNK